MSGNGKRPTQRTNGAAELPSWDEKVRQRAYEIYTQRSESEGSEIDDWLKAESELRTAHQDQPAPAPPEPAQP